MSRGANLGAVPAILLALLVVAFPACPGCASTGRAGESDRTGGRTVDMFVTRPGNSFARYQVVPGGDVRFAGGLAAVDGAFSWTGPLTDREIEQIFALTKEHGWETRDPPSRGEPADRRYRITLRGPGLDRRFEVIGDAPGVPAVEMILDGAARRRFDTYLERMPQPGEQPG